MADLTIKVKAENEKAKKGIKEVGDTVKDLEGKTKGFASTSQLAFASFAGSLGAGLATKALGFLVDSFTRAIDLAAEQEAAIVKLNAALKVAGEFSQTASQDFQNFASVLQENSTIGDEVTISVLAMVKSLGATNDEAKLIVQTAADMSVALNQDFGQVAKNLTKTLSGTLGELAEVNGELKDLSKESLLSGDAIRVLNEQFAGTAKENLGSYAASAERVKNAFGDMLEAFGRFVVLSENNEKTSQGIIALFKDITKQVDSARESITGFVKDVANKLVDLSLDATAEEIAQAQALIAKKEQDKLLADLRSGLDDHNKLLAQQSEAAQKRINDEKKRLEKEHLEYVSSLAQDQAQHDASLRIEERKKENEAFDKLDELLRQKSLERQQKIAGGLSLGANVLQGAGGAAGLLKGAAAQFGGPIGAAVAPFIDALGQGPDAVKGMVEEFAEALPALIENIADAIPVFIETLVDRAPEIIVKLTEMAPFIATSLIESLVLQAPNMAVAFIEGFIDNLPYLISSFADGIVNMFNEILNSLDPFGGNFLGLGLASGGQVKSVPSGFPSDSFPARLTSRELVVDQTTTEQLKSFLSGDLTKTNNSMNAILKAVNSPIRVESKVELDKNTFANIILNLSRTNVRTVF